MSHCAICDEILDEIQFDRRYNPIKIDDCPKCLDEIYKIAYTSSYKEETEYVPEEEVLSEDVDYVSERRAFDPEGLE